MFFAMMSMKKNGHKITIAHLTFPEKKTKKII